MDKRRQSELGCEVHGEESDFHGGRHHGRHGGHHHGRGEVGFIGTGPIVDVDYLCEYPGNCPPAAFFGVEHKPKDLATEAIGAGAGAAIGAALGGPVGAAIGAMLGWFAGVKLEDNLPSMK